MKSRLKSTAYVTILALGLSSLGTAAQAGSLAVPAIAGGPGGVTTAGESLVQNAGHKRHFKKRGWHRGKHRHRSHRRHRHRDNDNDVGIALGAAGLILGLGALAATTQSQRRYAPAPAYRGSPQPWTRGWYQYCSSKYRSFEPATGYYTTYSGYKRFCR